MDSVAVPQSDGDGLPATSRIREALEKRRRMLGEEHPDTLISISNVGILLHAQGKVAEAVELLAPAEAAARKAFSRSNAVQLAVFLRSLGRSRVGLDYSAEHFAAAEANLLDAYSIFVKARGETHNDTMGCVQGLLDLYSARDKGEPLKGHDAQAAKWRAKLAEWQATTRPNNQSTTPTTEDTNGKSKSP